jgi:hypothetical protein
VLGEVREHLASFLGAGSLERPAAGPRPTLPETTTAISVAKESVNEDHNAFALVTNPIVWIGAGSGSINPRSYPMGNALPYDRVASSERALWFLKGKLSQVALANNEIGLEDEGAGFASDVGVEGASTNRRAARDTGQVDLGYHTNDFVDADADQIADVWESHFDPATKNLNPTGDNDGDVLTNLQEFQRGTSPIQSDTDVDLRANLGPDSSEAFVWAYNWAQDLPLAQGTVDPLRRNDFFFGGSVVDFKGKPNQKGGPIQTAFGKTSATFYWETGAATANDGIWVRRFDQSAFIFTAGAAGTVHTATVLNLQPDSLYFVKAQSNSTLISKTLGFYTQHDTATVDFDRNPYLQNPANLSPAASKVTVMWSTAAATNGNKVHIREAGAGSFTVINAPPDNVTNHEVVLNGLAPVEDEMALKSVNGTSLILPH